MSGVEPANFSCKEESLPAAHPRGTAGRNRTLFRGFGIRVAASARPYGATYEDRTRLTRSTGGLRHQSHHAASLRVLGASRTLEPGLGDRAPDPPAGTWGTAGSRTPSNRVTTGRAAAATAPWSRRHESNVRAPVPKTGERPSLTTSVLRARIERASLRLQRSAFARAAIAALRTAYGCRTRLVRVKTSRPPGSRTRPVQQAISLAPPARVGAGEWSRTTLGLFTSEVHSHECDAGVGCRTWIRTKDAVARARLTAACLTSRPSCKKRRRRFGVRRLRLTIMGDHRAIARAVTPCLVFKELGIHVSRAVPRAGFEPTFTGSEPVVLPLDDLGILTALPVRNLGTNRSRSSPVTEPNMSPARPAPAGVSRVRSRDASSQTARRSPGE
jgi:hypothetical protein